MNWQFGFLLWIVSSPLVSILVGNGLRVAAERHYGEGTSRGQLGVLLELQSRPSSRCSERSGRAWPSM